MDKGHSLLRQILESSSTGGILLMLVAVLAVLVANSSLLESYESILHTYVLGMSVLHWINDGLMAIFFLLVGLEIKREVLNGQLSSWSRRILPGVAALGGMIGPALVYLFFNTQEAGHPRGWAIPAATDIAFALGVLSLLGSRVPVSLRVFLTALAIIDDLGAVLIIALFYTSSLNMMALLAAALVVLILWGMNRAGVVRLLPYMLLGAVLWYLVLKSGMHATIAGVLLALTIPLRTAKTSNVNDNEEPPLLHLEHALVPWVTFLIVPVFGFANAGVSLQGMTWTSVLEPVPLGVALGLLLGKQIGVFVAAMLAIRLGWADLPARATWKQLYGVALLCGIGFTMSLFIGMLAFPEMQALQSEVKIGVLLGSIVSAVLGAILLIKVGKSNAL